MKKNSVVRTAGYAAALGAALTAGTLAGSRLGDLVLGMRAKSAQGNAEGPDEPGPFEVRGWLAELSGRLTYLETLQLHDRLRKVEIQATTGLGELGGRLDYLEGLQVHERLRRVEGEVRTGLPHRLTKLEEQIGNVENDIEQRVDVEAANNYRRLKELGARLLRAEKAGLLAFAAPTAGQDAPPASEAVEEAKPLDAPSADTAPARSDWLNAYLQAIDSPSFRSFVADLTSPPATPAQAPTADTTGEEAPRTPAKDGLCTFQEFDQFMKDKHLRHWAPKPAF